MAGNYMKFPQLNPNSFKFLTKTKPKRVLFGFLNASNIEERLMALSTYQLFYSSHIKERTSRPHQKQIKKT
jgi:hypothetical protein